MAAVDAPVTTAGSAPTFGVRLVQFFGWGSLGVLAALLINNYLTFWLDWPGGNAALNGGSALSYVQLGLYAFAIGIAASLAFGQQRDLRRDSAIISDVNMFFIRGAFWAVFMVGSVDAVISFLRVEGILQDYVGAALAGDLGRSTFRGTYVHWPLVGLGYVIAALSPRTLGFIWLALLVVLAELLIVISRFVFSYEQAFMADLVRFWYGALFLFASAYTLLEEGHVRVDVFYAAFERKTKGMVNSIGCVVLGMSLCWTILIIGMAGKSNVINSPLLAFEVTQTGFGMYVKYFMAAFLAVFGISMMVQFVSYLFDAVADWRGEPGGRDHDDHSIT